MSTSPRFAWLCIKKAYHRPAPLRTARVISREWSFPSLGRPKEMMRSLRPDQKRVARRGRVTGRDGGGRPFPGGGRPSPTAHARASPPRHPDPRIADIGPVHRRRVVARRPGARLELRPRRGRPRAPLVAARRAQGGPPRGARAREGRREAHQRGEALDGRGEEAQGPRRALRAGRGARPRPLHAALRARGRPDQGAAAAAAAAPRLPLQRSAALRRLRPEGVHDQGCDRTRLGRSAGGARPTHTSHPRCSLPRLQGASSSTSTRRSRASPTPRRCTTPSR